MPEDQTTQIYGPIAKDLALVEELLESVKSVDISALQKMLEHALESRGKRLRPGIVLLISRALTCMTNIFKNTII